MLYLDTEFIEDSPRSPDEVFALDSSRVTRSLQLLSGTFAARQQAVADFLGSNTVAAGALGGVSIRWITRQLPMRYAALSSASNLLMAPFLYAASIPHGEPVGKPTGVIDVGGDQVSEYTRYRVQLVFNAFSYDLLPDADVLALSGPLAGFPDEGDALSRGVSRFITKTVRPGGRIYVLRNGIMEYVSDGNKVPEGIPFNEPHIDVEYLWHLVPNAGVPWRAILETVGCVNASAFDGFPAGTLLFQGVETQRLRGPLGDRLWNLIYHMRCLPRYGYQSTTVNTAFGWNAILRVVGGQLDYVPLKSSVTGQPPYKGADFAALFRPDPLT